MSYHRPETKLFCAKAYLDYVRSLRNRTFTHRETIEQRRALLLPCGIDYSETVSKSVPADTVERAIIELNELIAMYATDLVELVEQESIATNVFKSLSRHEYCLALMKYYLQGKTWTQVCAEMGYTKDGMKSLRKRALLEVYDVMPEEWRRDPIPNAQPNYTPKHPSKPDNL